MQSACGGHALPTYGLEASSLDVYGPLAAEHVDLAGGGTRVPAIGFTDMWDVEDVNRETFDAQP